MVQLIRFEHEERAMFVELEIRDRLLLKRSGAIGAPGETRQVSLGFWGVQDLPTRVSEAVLRKGYRRVKTSRELEIEKPPHRGPERNRELEAAIIAAPNAVGPRIVYADWLQSKGDPRGELIAVQLALESGPQTRLRDRERTLFQVHGAMLLGALRRYDRTMDINHEEVFTWRRGFIDSVRISYDYRAVVEPFDAVQFLVQVLQHPSAAFVSEVHLGYHDIGSETQFGHFLPPLLDVVVTEKPETLRRLQVGDNSIIRYGHSWGCNPRIHVGSLAGVWPAFPQLESLTVQGEQIDFGRIDAPELREAIFASEATEAAALRSITTASWPKLERLEIELRDHSAGERPIQPIQSAAELRPILDAKGLPNLRRLALRGCFGDEIAAAVGTSKVLEGLATLDLSGSGLTDAGARALVANAPAFRGLARLDLSENYLTESGERMVERLSHEVDTHRQRLENDPRGYTEEDAFEDHCGYSDDDFVVK